MDLIFILLAIVDCEMRMIVLHLVAGFVNDLVICTTYKYKNKLFFYAMEKHMYKLPGNKNDYFLLQPLLLFVSTNMVLPHKNS